MSTIKPEAGGLEEPRRKVDVVVLWRELRRDDLRATSDFAVVVVPIGATEQHGPHLPTGTDSDIATAVAVRAADSASRHGVGVVVLPTIEFGVSAHHLRFGGTISVRTETQLAVLRDVLDSLEVQGFTRVLIVNGHGGNTGVCVAAASEADVRPSLTVASINWWDAAGVSDPGHAGMVETAVQIALGRSVDTSVVSRVPADLPRIGVGYHGSWVWTLIDGVSDDPSQASHIAGTDVLDRAIAGVADIIRKLADTGQQKESDS